MWPHSPLTLSVAFDLYYKPTTRAYSQTALTTYSQTALTTLLRNMPLLNLSEVQYNFCIFKFKKKVL